MTSRASVVSCGVCQVGLVRSEGAIEEMLATLGPELLQELINQALGGDG